MLPANEPVLMADNRSYRYGDGIFETMKVINGKICLEQYHFERLFSSCDLMGYKQPAFLSAEKLKHQIIALCEKNNCTELARVRLSLSGGNGGLYDIENEAQYLIECWPLETSVNRLNENGLIIDIYPDVRKSCDRFSSIKSANFLAYVMAARYAKQNRLNDCLVLNIHDRIADSTIANIFLIKQDKIITPPLTDGCISGVMRKYLLESLKSLKGEISIEENVIIEDELISADEVFLTNAVHGIKWVGQFRDKKYSNTLTAKIYSQFIRSIFQ